MLGGSGQGEQIAANKVPGIRAALCNDLYTARLSREHNDANVLSMGGRIVAFGLADEIVTLWLETAVRRRAPPARAIDQIAPRAETTGVRLSEAHMTTDPIRMWRTLAEADPEIADAIRNEIAPPEQRPRADRLGELRQPRGARSGRLGAHEQVRRRLSRAGATTAAASSSTSSRRAAIARAKALFGAEHANVQPHSGAQANMAVYFTLLKPGDTVLGMNLAHGGHLTHGHPLNFSGKLYTIVPYGVRKDDERIDYDELERLADEHKPKMIIVGASAYPRVIDFARIRAIADGVGAPVMADMAHIAGLVAAGVHPSPVPHSDFVTTTTHKTLRGPRGGHGALPRAVREGARPRRCSPASRAAR